MIGRQARDTAPGAQLLWRAMSARRRDLVAASIFYSTHQLGESLVPVIIGAVVGQAIAQEGAGRIVAWLGVLAADFAFLSLSYRFGARASARAEQGSAHAARLWLAERVLRDDGAVALAPGDLVSRAGSDCARIGAFADTLALAISRGAVLLFATVVLMLLSPILGVVILAGTALLLLVQNWISQTLERRSGVEQAQIADATAVAEDLIRGLRVLKGIGATRTAAADYSRLSGNAVSAALSAVSAQSLLNAVAVLLTGLYLAAIAGLGGWLALSGHIGLGALVSALGLAQFVIDPMGTVAGIHTGYARALASATRVQAVIDTAPAIESGKYDLAPETLDVRFEDVLLGTTDDSAEGASFTALTGRLTGIVADTASTAAAIAALLARERDPSAGEVTLGGIALPEWSLPTLRMTLLTAPHDAALFPGTVVGNIELAAHDEQAIAAASRAATADQVADVLPDGPNTQVGDRGQNLSGGQRQRVALARALAADPPVLVLHEPTTSVDAATEDLIATRVRDLRAGHSTIVITSSQAWLSRCDDVVFIAANAGTDRHVRCGTHAELVAESATYAQAVSR